MKTNLDIINKIVKHRAKARAKGKSLKVNSTIVVEKYGAIPSQAKTIILGVQSAEKTASVAAVPKAKTRLVTEKPVANDSAFIDDIVAVASTPAKKTASVAAVPKAKTRIAPAKKQAKAQKAIFYKDPDTGQTRMLRVLTSTDKAVVYELDKPRLVEISVGGKLITVNENDVKAARASGKASYKNLPLPLVESAMTLALITL